MKDNASEKSNALSQRDKWEKILNGAIEPSEIVVGYLTDQIQFEYLTIHKDEYTNKQIDDAISIVIDSLENTSIGQIKRLLRYSESLKKVNKSNVPQYSNFASAAICVPETLVDAKAALSYRELGYALYEESKSDSAAEKYGENHGKMAALLDLAIIKKENGHKVFYPSALSARFCQMEQSEKMELLTRLCYRIPFVQNAIVTIDPHRTAEKNLKDVLAPSTYERRISNAQEVLAFALEE